MSNTIDENSIYDGTEIAIIGMSGRFPGANDLETFWSNVRDGVESLSFFTDEELAARGVDPELRNQQNYVKAAALLEDLETFDASFFGYKPREAEMIDPQHRLFLECAWQALEHAGYDSNRYSGLIGVYAGTTLSSYLLLNLASHYREKQRNPLDDVQLGMGNAADFLTTRVSYKLNLTGPSHTVQTACSSSLVAVHVACQSLLNGECDMALAGGVSVNLSHRSGYLYLNEGIVSPDGHCRAFDARAQGTIFGNGVGIVVLKRLEDALHSSDTIHAIIRGSAINNDGANKAGYTAPGVEGQARVIAESLANAGLNARDIQYIEAHGTGTPLGDPIEIQALKKVYQEQTSAKQFCALGSVKTNIGHLDAAAGIAGLLKTVLMLKAKQLAPSLHFEQPNPQIDFAHSPFYVNNSLRPWPTEGTPRRAGVSSFGIGGTNAHVILEEAPLQQVAIERPSRPRQVLLLSAKTALALETATSNLAAYLRQDASLLLADVAYTLQVGRHEFSHRRMLVCQDREDALLRIDLLDSERLFTASCASEEHALIFMFPDGGTEYLNMGRQLYEVEAAFRRYVDTCAAILQPQLGLDLRQVLYPTEEQSAEAAKKLLRPSLGLPALFIVSYSLAQLWFSWGVQPTAMIGHSLGEYVAACLAGVFSLEDALALVVVRGRLFERLPAGAMLSIPLSQEEIKPLLDNRLSLATINGPAQCVVSGAMDALIELQMVLQARGIETREVQISVAAHSTMIDAILPEFTQVLQKLHLHAPTLPYMSNVTGRWIREEEARDPQYWGRHLRETVRFGAGVQMLKEEYNPLWLEVGPGRTLSTILKQHLSGEKRKTHVINSLPHPQERQADFVTLLQAAGKLWCAGESINWQNFYAQESRLRVPLPTYPFERQRYWVEPYRTTLDEIGLQKNRTKTMKIQNPNMQEEQQIQASASSSERQQQILDQIKSIASAILGDNSESLHSDTNLFELGFDSLSMVQINHTIKESFGVVLSIQQLFDDLSTLQAIAAYIDQQLPSVPSPTTTGEIQLPVQPDIVLLPVSQNADPTLSQEQLLAQQLQLLSQQLELQRTLLQHQMALFQGQKALPLDDVLLKQNTLAALPSSSVQEEKRKAPATNHDESVLSPFAAYQPLRSQMEYLTAQQQKHLDALIARYVLRTQQSKMRVQESRFVRVNHRNSMAFRLLWKEMVYPIIAPFSRGAHVWDIDGNEYIDLTMGFGVALFGHSMPFITEAIEAELKQGLLLGPYTDKAEQVARLIAELTGVERVAFYNSGTEAVMVALRTARAATGRSKIVIFSGSFHGTFDGVQATADFASKEKSTVPLAPGITQNIIADVLVLQYGNPQSLEIIKQHGSDLAAVLVEPVQSRRPDLQPREFLHQLRHITTEMGIALIFDEMITGFRLHPGGAQRWYEIEADLVTYGKVVGGGMPIGVVAGKAAFMDSIDGGSWRYGDNSYPPFDRYRTIVGGTFCEHPLTMASALAVLTYLKEQGPNLQQQLNERTDNFAQTLNSYFQQEQLSIRIANCGSLFRFIFHGDFDLLYYHLLEKGIYTWEGRTCFLSTAHSDQDIATIIQTIKDCIQEMREGGFLPASSSPASAKSISHPSENEDNSGKFSRSELPLSEDQRQLWFLTQQSNEASCAYNDSAIITMHGQCDLPTLHKALHKLVERHEALHTKISPEGDKQIICAHVRLEVPLLDWSNLAEGAYQQHIEQWLQQEISKPFKMEQAPLLRASILKKSETCHELVVLIHHMVADGWSWNILLHELSALYSAERHRQSAHLEIAHQFREYLQWRVTTEQESNRVEIENYWRKQLLAAPQVLLLPTNYVRPPYNTYRGARCQKFLSSELYQAFQYFSQQQRCSLFIVALAAFGLFLYRLSDRQDFIIGVPLAGQASMKVSTLVGHCTNMVPLRYHIERDASIATFIKTIRMQMMDLYNYQDYTFSLLASHPGEAGELLSQLPIMTVMFNMDRATKLPTFAGLETEIRPGPTYFVKFDLSLNLIEMNGQLRLDLDINTNLFSSSSGQSLLQYFEMLVQNIITHPHNLLSSLPHIDRVALGLQQWSEQMEVQVVRRVLLEPQNETEAIILGIWQALFNKKDISIDDNFFMSGGQSLLAMQLLSRLQQAFHTRLPLKVLFEAATIKELAAVIQQSAVGETLSSFLLTRHVDEEKASLLSFAQQRLWYVCQIGADVSYNIFALIKILGPLNSGYLQQSVNEIMRRHHVLRTIFVQRDEKILQILQEYKPLPIRMIQLEQQSEVEMEEQIKHYAHEDASTPFSLSEGPLLRVTLLKVEDSYHVLSLVVHHIVFDGWSQDIFLREMTALYQAYCEGKSSPLPELSLQYTDYARWQRQWLQSEHYTRQLTYWKTHLGSNPPILDLPTDRPRPPMQSFQGASYYFVLPNEVTQAVRSLSQQENVTLFMFLLTAFQALLHLYSGQKTILVGIPSANRQQIETENIIGFFVNMLVIRTDFVNHPGFSSLLQQVREVVLNAYAHQDLPFDKLVEELITERDPSRSPIFQTMFLLDTRPAQFEIAGVKLSQIASSNDTSKFDLSFMMQDTGKELLGEFEYNTELFDESTAMRMSEQYITFLKNICADPDAKF